MKTVALLLFIARVAHADACFDPPAACAVSEGKTLLATAPDRAAQRFLASYRLEPKLATLGLYAVALTKAKDFVHAYGAWRQVRDQARDALRELQRDGSAAADDLARAQERVASAEHALLEVEPEVARVRLQFSGTAPTGLVVAREGEGDLDVAADFEVVVLPGRDVLRLIYHDGRRQDLETHVSAGHLETIAVPSLDPAVAISPIPPQPENPPPPPVSLWTKRRKVAVGVAGGGVALVVAAIFVDAAAHSDSDAARAAGCTADDVCTAAGGGFPLAQRAHTEATLATIFVIGGVGAIGAAAALWFTGHPARTTQIGIAPIVSPQFVGLTIGGFL